MSRSNESLHTTSDRLEYTARRRAGAKLGWFLHACIYIVVNLGLAAAAFSQGRHWAIYPAIFWGIGLLAHGASVWLLSPHGALWQRMVQRERDALKQHGDASTTR